ncbi:MAG: ketoacyl-ACP synthase III [Proteobacteria bacterium]|nr:ketoacyl-ACP synthase III [Pseudomonadota bacterium]MDA0960249.1 ketoacyl-ACP synthase III [Pseudomonadota bacterium]MDA1152072.1 ketoacyl-ACP synthase III [Pseudomonadota bacterium]
MSSQRVLMTAVGSYLPANVVTNEALSSFVDTDDAWIRRRTGIAQRHLVADGETTADLANNAASKALANAGMTGADIDLIIVATTTPDNTFPSTATKLQNMIGAKGAIAFDVQAVCAGFVYALDIADAMLQSGRGRRALVVGAESFSKLLDWKDRTTCVLFGDGAGAVVLELADNADDWGIRSSVLHSDGAYRDILYVDGGPSLNAAVGHVRMEGKEVFRHAVEKLASVMDEALSAANMQAHEIDWLVPHQANIRIIDAMQKKMGLPSGRVVRTVEQHANTSAASIPLALATAVGDGRIKNGDVVAMEAIGGGLVWGAALVKFGRP